MWDMFAVQQTDNSICCSHYSLVRNNLSETCIVLNHLDFITQPLNFHSRFSILDTSAIFTIFENLTDQMTKLKVAGGLFNGHNSHSLNTNRQSSLVVNCCHDNNIAASDQLRDSV